MEKREFSIIRHHLGKTQAQMAQLLGVSLKATQSFEQGYRKVPVHVERQLLFLLASKKSQKENGIECWTAKECSTEAKGNCPAWEFQVGHLCWFINGTICHGEAHKSWQEKMVICRTCEFFSSLLPEELSEELFPKTEGSDNGLP